MKTIISYRPGVISNRSAFECMALIYKQLQKQYDYQFVIVKSQDDAFSDDELNIITIPRAAWKCMPDTPFRLCPFIHNKKIKRIIKNADILLTVDPTVYPQGCFAINTAYHLRIPVWIDTSVTSAGNSQTLIWKLFRLILLKTLRKTTGIIATAPKCMERFRDLKLYDDHLAKKFIVMGHPVDTDKFRPGVKKSTSDGIIRVLTISRLVPEKGLYYILEALDPILRESDHLFWDIVGDGLMKSFLQKEVKERGLDGKIKFYHQAPHDQMASIFSSADIFISHAVSTNRWEEYFGAVNLEAMACELPCILTRTGGITYAVRENDVSIMVEPRDVSGLREALKSLLSDKNKRQKMGESAREYIRKTYDLPLIVEKYHHMLTGGLKEN